MSRRNHWLLAALATLLAALLVVEQPWAGDAVARTRAAIQPVYPGLEGRLPEVVEIEISSARTTTRLRRLPQGWTVPDRFNAPADPAHLASLLTGLIRLTDRNTVSDNPENQATYSVTAADGTRIRLLDKRGNVLADLISGGLRHQKIQSGGKARLEFYVRPAGSNAVLLTNFRPPVVLPEDWIDPAVLPPGIEAGMVDWIQREDREGAESWRAVRVRGAADGADSWRLVAPDSGPVRSRPCETLAAAFTGLRALDVVGRAGSDGPGTDFGEPANVIHIGIGDLSLELWLGRPADEGGRLAWVRGGDFVYRIPEFAAERMRVPLELLQAAEKD